MGRDTNMRGAYFKNKDKKTDRHPDYKGSAIINNVRYWVAIWISVSDKTGEKYLSTSYTKKDNQDEVKKPVDKKPDKPADIDDDIPF